MMSSDDVNNEAPRLPRDAQARIGARLRQMYDSVVQEPIPDRFKSLLDQLQGAPGDEARTPPGPAASDAEPRQG